MSEWKMVPAKPTKAMLRPFIQCPDDELELAYEAMLIIAAHTPSDDAGEVELAKALDGLIESCDTAMDFYMQLNPMSVKEVCLIALANYRAREGE
jgi:hypothetical protein